MPDRHNPDHLDELGDMLCTAVDAVRSEPPPADRMARAVEEARRLGPLPTPQPNRHRWALLAVTGAIALVMVGYGTQDEGWPWRSGHTDSAGHPQAGTAPTSTDVDLVASDYRPPRPDATWHKLPLDSRGGPVVDTFTNTIPPFADPPVAYRGFIVTRPESPGLDRLTLAAQTGEQLRERIRAERARLLGQLAGQEPVVWHRDRAQPTVARVLVGEQQSLDLVSLHFHVMIEGPRARTLVDHVFRNPHDRQLEGAFEYPLPTGASPCYFALFPGKSQEKMPALFTRRGNAPPVPADTLARMTPAEVARQVNTDDWGGLHEGRVVPKDKALETYEEVVRGRVDPALLEYAGGNTFRGRVFPIPPKGYSRVLLAYEELLPVVGDQLVYRFTLPDRKLAETSITLTADTREALRPTFHPENAARATDKGRVTFHRQWKDAAPDSEAVFRCEPARLEVQAVSGRQEGSGPYYLCARVRPQLPALDRPAPFAHHAVFMLDTSQSEYPDAFAVRMKLLQNVLESDTDIRFFNVLVFNVGAAWLEPGGWLPNTAEGRRKGLGRLDGLLLEGATDVSCALDALCRPAFAVAPGTPLNCFLLSDGNLNWGETDPAVLVGRFEHSCPFRTRFHCYRTGLGEENADLFDALTRGGGGVYACRGETELAAAATAHRRECLHADSVRFVGGPKVSDVLVSGRQAAVYPGGEMVVVARFAAPGRTTLVLEGTFAGRRVVRELPLEVRDGGELAPRAWAETAVASLSALHDESLGPLVTAYCQQFGIGSRVASFLVLENDSDFKRFKLDEERGKAVPGDLGAFVEGTWMGLGQEVTPRQELDCFLHRVDRQVPLLRQAEGGHIRRLLAALRDDDLRLPPGHLRWALPRESEAAADYVAGRKRDCGDVSVYVAEAQRRAAAGDVDGAVRALSGVVEEHPGRDDALRLVGYRLLNLKQPVHAARLFTRVQRQRPFEAHAYRDLAQALEACGRPALAALQYEIILARSWHRRFGEALNEVAQEEYAALMQDAIRRGLVRKELLDLFGERLEQMARPQPKSDLRVTISWNTDATDVDLWVIEPDGTKVFFSNPHCPSGGELSADQTQGYGPERYRIAQARPGTYQVLVHYFRPNPNLLGGETHVQVCVTRHAGTSREETRRYTLILRRQGEAVEVCRVSFASRS
jgi:hypothetical protein